jgi:hypothetical protein
MQEFAPYLFTGELGDQAQILDKTGVHYSTSLFIGFLDGDGPSGLDDTPKRQSTENVTQGHGGAAGPVLDAPREFTFPVMVPPDPVINSLTQAQRLTALDKATMAGLPFGGNVRWFDSDLPTTEKILYYQRAQPFRVTGRRPRIVNLGFLAVEPRITSVTKHSQAITGGAPAQTVSLTNAGTRDAPWRAHLNTYNNVTITIAAAGPYPGSKVVIPGSGSNLVVQGGRLPGIFTDSGADPSLPSYQDSKGWSNLVIAAGAAKYPDTYWGGFPPGARTVTFLGGASGTFYWWDAW